jgi:hypothetical protein
MRQDIKYGGYCEVESGLDFEEGRVQCVHEIF